MTEPTPTAPQNSRAPVHGVIRYGIAVAAPLVALALTYLAPPLQERAAFALFFGAVAVASWFGLAPGLLATGVSALLVDIAFIPPAGTLKPLGADDVARLLVFAGIASFIAALSERSRVARAEAEARRVEAEELARQLQDRASELEHQSRESQSLTTELEESNIALGTAAQTIETERARVAHVLDGLDDAVGAYDTSWRLVHANGAAEAAMREAGLDPAALLGAVLWDAIPWTRGTRFEAEALRAVAERAITEFDDVSPTIGRFRHVRILPTADGAIIVSRDVSDQRRAEARLAESEGRFHTMADSAPVLVWMAGTDGRRDWFNRAWLEFTGRALEDELGEGWAAGVHPDDLARCLHVCASSFDARREFEIDYRLLRHDGEHRWIIDRGVPRVDANGVFEGFIGSVIDITERRQADEAVRVSEARYRALVEASSTMVWRTDADGLIDDMPMWRELTGQSIDEVRGHGWTTAIHPDDRPRVARVWAESVRTRQHYDSEYRIRLAAGGYRWFVSRGVPMTDGAGVVSEWVGTFSDVHERRRAESALEMLADASRLLASRDVERTLQAVARLAVPGHADYCVVHVVADDGAVSHAVAHSDPEGEEALAVLVERPPADPQGEFGWTAAIRTGRAQHFPAVERAPTTYVRDQEHHRLLQAVGTRSAIVLPLVARDIVLGAMTLGSTDADRRFDARDVEVAEQLARRVALALDSARLFEAEQQARATAEAASRTKSEFLATMSHELRTPLNAVLGYTSLIIEEISGPITEEQRTQLQRVQGSARHLLALIEEILTLSRLEAGSENILVDRVDLCALARDTAAMVEPSLSVRGLGFLVDVPAAPVLAVTDAVKVRQVLLNLLANAAKFTDGGEVALTMRANAERAVFEVRDTGIGIAPENMERIFEPFWQVEQSKRRRAGGTGLGLHLARRLARLLGGDVAVTSTPLTGSTFTFWISANADAPSPDGGSPPFSDDGAPRVDGARRLTLSSRDR